jgi:hypothetical protein
VVKPVSFDKVPSTAPTKAPKPLSFPPSPPKAAPPAPPPVSTKPLAFPPSPPKTPTKPVFFDNGGQWVDGKLKVTTDPALLPPPPPAQVPKTLSFDNVRVPVKPTASPLPRPVMSSHAATTGIHGDALKLLRTSHPDLVRQEELAVVRQLQQLLPLNIVVILDWGTKTMERMRDDTREATNLVTMFVQANGNDLIERAVNAISGVKPKKFLDRMLNKADDPVSLEPALAALQSQLIPWMKQIDERIVSAKKHNFSTVVKLATLAAVADTIDQITDNSLDLAINNRRMILQQGVTQSELTIQTLEDVRQQIIDQKMRIDQVLNVTLPAYKAARARSK